MMWIILTTPALGASPRARKFGKPGKAGLRLHERPKV